VTAPVRSCTPVLYVTDVPDSVRFYALLGFVEQVAGTDAQWRYSYLKCDALGLLLAGGGMPSHGGDAGPVTLYLQVVDVAAMVEALREAGVPVEHLGYPDHAPGGEAKVVDPDGFGVMLGQVTGMVPAGDLNRTDPQRRPSVLRRAAAAARQRGAAPQRCQVAATGGGSCDADAEVKLADSWGDTVWACLRHGEEIIINAPAAFLASEASEGIAAYLRRRALG
jgi:hypothetical protein